jgi:TolA-binding protein
MRSFVDHDMTVAEIKEKIRSSREDIPELRDVKLSQTKDALIESTIEAVEKFYQRQQGMAEDGSEMNMETSTAPDVVADNPPPKRPEDTDEEEETRKQPISRQRDTLGGTSNPLTP